MPSHFYAPLPRVQRAAVVVEAIDPSGELVRMVYAFDPRSPLTLDLEPEYPDIPSWDVAMRIAAERYRLHVEGIALEGRIWAGPMPGEDAAQLDRAPSAIEAPRAPD